MVISDLQIEENSINKLTVNMKLLKYRQKKNLMILLGIACASLACQKTTSISSVSGVAAFTVVNAIPNSVSQGVIPIINTSSAIMWFNTALPIRYGFFHEYSPVAGADTVYVVQDNVDTVDVAPKATGQMFYSILPLKRQGVYSLFLCGVDTTSPDYLFTIDTLPYHSPLDSVVGIRFVNLSTGSNPISINIEGNSNGSEVGSLPYKGITGFKDYLSNSTINSNGYLFVFRDAKTGDSLTQISLTSGNGVPGLSDPNKRSVQLTFKNVTIALIGQPGVNAAVPQSVILIDDF